MASPGGTPARVDTAPRFDTALRAALAARLAALGEPAAAAPCDLKRAAVCLIVADDGAGAASVVLTLRPGHLARHANQFALPGGRLDPGESPLEAALRECREEVSLELDADAILGRLDEFATRSGYLITPFVAWMPANATMTPNPAEVAEIFRVPFAEFSRPGSPEFVSIPESDRPVIRYPILGTRVHAPTAAMVYQFIECAVHGRVTRVAHLEQPVWAWR